MWLRVKLSAGLAVLIAMPLMLAFGMMWFSAQGTLRASGTRDLEAATRAVAHGIDARLGFNLTNLKAWSALPVMQDTLIGDNGGDIARTLGAFKAQYPDIAHLVATDAKGIVVAATEASDRRRSLANDDGFAAAMSGRVQQAMQSGRGADTISFTVPVIAGYDGQTVIGTLTGTLDINAVVKIAVAGSTLTGPGNNVVVTRRADGRILFASKRDGMLFDALKTAGVGQTAGSTTIGWKGETYLVSSVVASGKDFAQPVGLAVHGLAPAGAIFAAADRLLLVTLVAGVLAAGLALGLAWHWSTPLVEIESAMARVARGDVTARVGGVAPQHTFAPLARSLEVFRQTKTVRDRLAAREADLTRAKEDAEAALHAKSEHLASLSRALKDQLSTIVELSQAVSRENLSAVTQGRLPSPHAADISRSAAQLLDIVNDLFDLSEAEAGHLRLDESEVDLAALVRDAVVLMSEAADKVKVTLSASGSDDAMRVKADAHKLKQILFNLLSNAVKFTPAGGTVAVALRVDSNGRPTILIDDTGIGMPMNLSPVAFAGRASAQGHHGAGLGLPLVRQLVQLHGGTLEIESEIDRGTTAKVVLPAARLLVQASEAERISA